VKGWLLDTNILSELRRPRPDPRVLTFIASQPLDSLFVSTVTLAEIRFGIELTADARHRSALLDWLNQRVRPMFAGRILAVSEDVMLRWRLMVEEGRKINHTFSQPDLIIAATALDHGLTLVSRDQGDFVKTPVTVFNPWRPEPSVTSG
jgi:toxin FitB